MKIADDFEDFLNYTNIEHAVVVLDFFASFSPDYESGALVRLNHGCSIHIKNIGAGGAIRARDLCDQGIFAPFSPDYESGALARLGYPGMQIATLATG